MRLYCPACGAQVTFPADDPVKRARKMRAWVLHTWDCVRIDRAWRPGGSDVNSRLTWWQARRYVAIRDSALGEDMLNPWVRHPVCQACGAVARGTVNKFLHGRQDGFDFQHILPRSRGGTDDPRNVAVLCHPCHVRTFKRGYRGVPGSRKTAETNVFSFGR